MADAYRAFAHARPGLYAAAMRSADAADTELADAGKRVVDVALIVLQPYGLSGTDALHIVRALRSILHGFVDLEAAGGFGLPLDCDETFRRLIKLFIDGLQSRRDNPAR
jgi:Tetracyclin repressor-like, C-terminal domain